MEKQTLAGTSSFVSLDERSRLVRLCASITRDGDIAEDLAQETLLEAWRHEQTLRDPERRSQWLSGIARNVCLRWMRQRGHDSAHLLNWDQAQEDQNTHIDSLENVLVDDFDLEVELERKELVELLERAMALLPEKTRTVLIKRVLTTTLQQELALYATQASTSDDWEETPLWCHLCGRHRLRGKRTPDEGELLLKCPACDVWSVNHLPALQGVKGYKPLYTRLAAWCNDYYQTGLSNGTIPCAKCGRMLLVSLCLIEEIPTWALQKGMVPSWFREAQGRLVSTICPACHSACNTSLDSLALMLPEGRSFLQSYPRVRTLPYQHVEASGRQAIVTRFESITENATFTVVSDYDTYQVLSIFREGGV